MVDRHWFGDLALAVLLMLPLATLVKSQPTDLHQSSNRAVSLTAERAPTGRISILG